MKKQSKASWNQLYVLLTFVAIIITLAIYFNKDFKQKLSENSAYTTAKVIDIEERFQKGLFIKYQYYVNGQHYTSYIHLPKKVHNIQVGDELELHYAVEKPEYNEVVFDNMSY
ncbi:PDZ domain-containing secreted protein [Catalinimonas alkaloidigena]|uniref:hypothetical protein n=1 Tax=Catalinimonas alkaloidigena TaxID=1075417 RepID=UPI002405C543|nr:hypothetical protein [Catalinimonas alkaloidigena]MDF9800160.1 PDZ domain-containing secreted protein [Catalinimonas alkaloidigena]